MADRFPKQLVGVIDGTLFPPAMADGREILAASSTSVLTKVTGTGSVQWAVNDVIRLGKKPANSKITSIKLCVGATINTSTFDIGTPDDPDKYVDAVGDGDVINIPREIGPRAAALAEDVGEEEELIATVNTANIAAGTALTFIIEMVGMS